MRQSRKTNPKPRDTSAKGPPISHVIMPPNIKYRFPTGVSPIGVRMKIYLFEEEMMRAFGIGGEGLVAVKTSVKLIPDMVLVCRQGEAFHIGRVIYDPFSKLHAIEKGAYDLVFMSEVKVLGEPVGYCALKNVNRKLIKFRRIPVFNNFTRKALLIT